MKTNGPVRSSARVLVSMETTRNNYVPANTGDGGTQNLRPFRGIRQRQLEFLTNERLAFEASRDVGGGVEGASVST